MGRFRNVDTGIVISVDDSKDDRYGDGWESAETEPAPKKATAKKATASTSNTK